MKRCGYRSRDSAIACKGASPHYFGKVNAILTLRGGGGGFRLVTLSDVLTKIVWRRPLILRLRAAIGSLIIDIRLISMV